MGYLRHFRARGPRVAGGAAFGDRGAECVVWIRFGPGRNVSQDGGAIVLFIFVSAPVQVALLVLAAAYKGNAAAYLGYKLPRRSEVVFGIAVLAALIVVGDTVSWLAGRNIVDRFQTDIYQAARSASMLPLLLVAITVLIPVTEESLFRGFLFRGWLQITARCLACHRVHRRTVCGDPCSIRLVSHRPGVCLWGFVRVDTLGNRFDHSDDAAARLGQSGRHDRNGIDLKWLIKCRD